MKQTIMDWYIRHFIVQKAIQYDKPGYVITQFKSPYGEVFQREVFFPESLIADLEKEIVLVYGEEGRQVFYDIGKTLGYNFAYIFKSPCLKNNKPDQVKRYVEFVLKYIFSTWASDIELVELDIDNKVIRIKADQYIICRRNGIGHFLSEGAIAGFISYVFSDQEIEFSQITCQGRGDDKCSIIGGNPPFLNNNKVLYRRGNIIYEYQETVRNRALNSISKIVHSKESMYSLIKKGVFSYENGKILYQNERFFDSGVITYYLIELGLKKLKGADKISFDVGRKFGMRIGTGRTKEFILTFLSSLGWGDVGLQIIKGKYVFNIDHFPWCDLEENIENFYLFEGLLSGLISSIMKKEVYLSLSEKKIVANKNSFFVKFS